MVVGDQFPSNVYPWMAASARTGAKIVTVGSPGQIQSRGKVWNNRVLESINMHTKVVAIPQVHWSEGIIFDLEAIRKRTYDVNAFLVIDGTQSIGAFPFSIKSIQPDALICSSYKWLLGPYGCGLAYYGKRFDDGQPIENNWINRIKSEDFTNLVNYQAGFKPKAARYNVGEHSNFILIPMLQEAISRIIQWKPLVIQQYLGSITSPLKRLVDYGFVLPEENEGSNNVLGIYIPDNLKPKQLKEKLQRNNVYISVRGKYLRISPYLYNDESDLEKLVDIIIKD